MYDFYIKVCLVFEVDIETKNKIKKFEHIIQ